MIYRLNLLHYIKMVSLVSVSLALILWLAFGAYPGYAQMCSLNIKNASYTKCDHTTPVCECTPNDMNECYFCFEIEQRHTLTRYVLSRQKIEIPGFGGRVWYANDSNGQLIEYPAETGSPIEPYDCPDPCNDTPCTDAYVTDGNSFRPILTINNRFPGPTLIVPNNSMVVVDVYNRLSSEATSIHWHGMHQMNTPWMDGVEHITQCGITPSSSFTYKFRAFPPGTHWYHSHSGAQRTDGLFGALIVREDNKPNIPDVGDYIDEPDNYTITLLDWQKASSIDLFAQIHAGIRFFNKEEPPVPPSPVAPTPTPTTLVAPTLSPTISPTPTQDLRQPRTCSPDGTEVGPVTYWSGLINGRGRHRDIEYTMTNLSIFSVQQSSRYRFRLIGAQSLFAYRFSIDEHKLRLIATDGHFVDPVEIDFIIIHSGERYDFILETKSTSGKDFFIRAETLEVENSGPIVCNIDNNDPDMLRGNLYTDHSAEAILHYGSEMDIPLNTEYDNIKANSKAKYMQCSASERCKAINCPFKNFPNHYYTDCIHIHQLNLLNPDDYNDMLPNFNTDRENQKFFNFGFEGDGQTSAINGRNFVFPSAPLQLHVDTNRSQDDIPNVCNIRNTTECDSKCRLVTPECQCVHVVSIQEGKSYQFVFTAVGPNRANNTNWNFAHPIHLHGHSFSVAKIGFGKYRSNGRIESASEDITCKNNSHICTKPRWSNNNEPENLKNNRTAPLKDTVLIPAGGYAVVYFKANNPGYWFLHCHIEVHQLEGMAVVINEVGNSQQDAPPTNIPRCGTQLAKTLAQQTEETKLFRNWTISLGVILSFIIVAETVAFILTCIYLYFKFLKNK